MGAAAAYVERHAASAQPDALIECARDIRTASTHMSLQVRSRLRQLRPHGLEDMNLREAKERVGDKVCLIGGFDQFHFFKDCTPEQTRAEVRRCFEEAGQNGGYILATSDHFFDADPKLIHAYADAARECVYA